MESLVLISWLNDFIFCPKSIYFHNLYEKFQDVHYKDTPQINGSISHESIDTQKASTKASLLQGTPVFSENFGLSGKIDTFDVKTGLLVERKRQVKTIYQGYLWQVYAQYFCLEEMGYSVKKIAIHSLEDNNRYEIPLPKHQDVLDFKALLRKIREFKLQDNFFQKPEKCINCIYANLCDSNPF